MTIRCITFLIITILLTNFVIAQNKAVITSSLTSKNIMVLKVDHDFHNQYGCSYPMTYQIDFPSGSTGLTAWRKYSINDRWISIQEKTANDFFNAIEAARFEDSINIAYISVPFSSLSDSLFIRITDANGNPVLINYNGISRYYDNRTAAVTVSCDDWSDWVVQDNRFSALLNLFRSFHLYVTVGVITDSDNSSISTWSILQQQLNAGYIEAASHSRSHPDTPYVDYTGEVIGSYDDILNHLTLPPLFSLGTSKQYVYTWIAPYGSFNHTIDSLMQLRSYLVSRLYSVGNRDIPFSVFSDWDKNVQHFGVTNAGIEIGAPSWGGGDTSISFLNSTFDSVVTQGGIYHFMWHPQVIYPDLNSPYLHNHLTYISNRTNIWYANFGHLYLYHLLQVAATSGISGMAGDNNTPDNFQLSQNFPNPFNPVTTIHYEIQNPCKVQLKIYDVLGREIKTIVNIYQNPGKYSVTFNGDNLPSGIYLYQLNTGDKSSIKKMMLLK